MSLSYEESYLGQMRALIGMRKMISIGARAIVLNDDGHVLFVQRSDNGHWVMPAGSMELDESIEDTCKREVYEESGLIAEAITLIAVYTNPRYSFVTSYGDPYQMVSFVFRVDAWSGTLVSETDETINAKFIEPHNLPDDIPALYRETINDLLAFDGNVIVK